jgi:hypothetical protein
MSCNSVAWFGVTLPAVVTAKAGTHNHRLWNMGPRLRVWSRGIGWMESV